MIAIHLQDKIIQSFRYTPTKSQYQLIDNLSKFVTSKNSHELFLLNGYAGTGKTTIISALVNSLQFFNRKCILMAPTGRAAKVLTSYANKSAYTIHKIIYRQKSSKDGFGEFVLDFNKHSDTIFIVDEASMIADKSIEHNIFGSGNLLDDLITYVYSGKNCKLILLGDTAQLPPVGFSISPALDEKKLASYDLTIISSQLTDIIRQEEQSGILFNATEIRKCIANEITNQLSIITDNFSDISLITNENLIEEITLAYEKYSSSETIVLCRSNKRANAYNQGIRNRILFREEQLTPGDFLMVVKNNYYWMEQNNLPGFIANGDITEVIKIYRYESLYGYHFAEATLRFIDYDNLKLRIKIILDTITLDSASLNYEDNKKFFYTIAEDYAEIKSKKKRFQHVKEDPYFNALQVKFAYAVTCHKAQGGQWKAVFIDHGYINPQQFDNDFFRWLYTAFTRATEKLYLVNFHTSLLKQSSLINTF